METATKQYCVGCEREITNGECLNVDCPEAQYSATAEATRITAKATVRARSDLSAPRAWNSFGNVD